MSALGIMIKIDRKNDGRRVETILIMTVLWLRFVLKTSRDFLLHCNSHQTSYKDKIKGNSIIIMIKVYIYPTLCHVTQGKVSSEVQLVLIQNFPSPRLVS